MHQLLSKRHFTLNLVSTESITKLLKYKKNNLDDKDIINQAFKIYDAIPIKDRTHLTINALLQICIKMKKPHKVLSFWSDIINIKTGVRYPLVLKCCVSNIGKDGKDDKDWNDKCIEILKWMKYDEYKLLKYEIKDYSMSIVKLISNNNKNIKLLKQIHSLINMEDFNNSNFIKTALINGYGECNNIKLAKLIFDSINDKDKDDIIIGIMMKALLKNNDNDHVLLLHNKYYTINNDIINMYALQACINNNQYETGLNIIKKNINKRKIGKQLENSLINFYGNFGNIQQAKSIFDQSIIDDTKNKIVNINVMLKSYINNGYNIEALSLYDENKNIANDISHTLALKACINLKDNIEYIKYTKYGKKIADNISNDKDQITFRSIQLNSTLIDFYGLIEEFNTAKFIFNCIKPNDHTMISIGCMMKVYRLNGDNDDAIMLYDKYNMFHNDILHLYAIKACIAMNDLNKGKIIHNNIIKKGGTQNIKLINSLIDFYGYFGDINQAIDIFNSISDDKKDNVSIGSMMNALLINDKNESVILLYDKYKLFIDNDDTLLCLIIKACINNNNFDKGQAIISKLNILDNNMERELSISLCNILIDFMATFGKFDCAKDIFDKIPFHKLDAVSIGTMMKTYINFEKYNDALLLYQNYESLHDEISNTLAIKACKNINDYDKGMQIYQSIITPNVEKSNIQYFNTIIDFFSHFDDLSMAYEIFNSIPQEKLQGHTLNMMMKSFMKQNKNEMALTLYNKYKNLTNDISHLYAIKACGNTGNIEMGQQIHQDIVMNNSNDNNIIIHNALTEFYGEINDIDTSWKLFNSINDKEKDSSTINVMMKYLVPNKESLNLYEKYYHLTDDISHVLAIKTCKLSGNEFYGNDIYDKIKDKQDSSIQLLCAFIDFFGHFNNIKRAKEIFESIKNKDSSCLNCMISAFIANNEYQEAIKLYDNYNDLKDNISHLLIIKICSKIDNFEKVEIIKKDMNINGYLPLQNTLIDYYGNLGDIKNAWNIFDSIPNTEKDIYTICSMMNALINCKDDQNCLKLFKDINKINNNIKPNKICYSILFKACTFGTSYHFGKEIHELLIKDNNNNKWILNETEIQITLINMYGKCGILNKCDEIYNKIKLNEYNKYLSEIGIWNAMINAYGRNGNIDYAKELFDIMKLETKLNGDFRTFIVLINACNHSGELYQAINIWNNEINDELIKYDRNIITSIIDCYSRKGYVEKGYDILKQYYIKNGNKYNNNDVIIFMVLLNGCNKFGNYNLAQEIYDEMEKYFSWNKSYMASANTILSKLYFVYNQSKSHHNI